MYDFYGAGLPTLNSTLDDEYQRRLGAMEMARLAQSQPPAAPPTSVVPPAAAVPAQGSQPFVDWPSYQQMRQGVDLAQAYREYVSGVLPNQLRAQGFSPEDVARGQAMFQNQIQAPMPTPAQAQPQETTTKGLASNAWDALVQEYGSLGRQAAAGKAVATGDTKRLAELAAEEGKEQPPAPVARFREAVGQPGSIWDLLSNTAKAAVQEPQGAFDSTLQMLAGFAPYIGAGMAGGAAGSVIPGVGSILGGAAAIGLTSADLEAGSKGLQLLRQAAMRDGIDLNDATAVKNWIEKGGAAEVYGPAVKAGLTSGAVSALAMGVAGKLGQRTEELLAQSNRVVPLTTEAAAGLRGQAKLAQAGEIAAGVGGFGAASALADLAAGQTPDEKDMFVNALTLLIPSLLHARGRFKEGVEAKLGEPPKPAAAKPEEVKPPEGKPPEVKPPEKKPDLTEEEIAGIGEEGEPPKEEAKAEVKAAAPEETKPPPPTEAEVESVKPFPTKDDLPTVTALQLTQEAHREALNEFFQQVGEEAKARSEERATTVEERTPANPLAAPVQPLPEEAAAAALQPSVATADVPLIRRGSFTAERTGEPAGNGPLLAGVGREVEAGPNRAEGTGVNEKSLYQGTAPEPPRGRSTRGAGRSRAKPAAEPRIPVSDEGRNQPGGTGGNLLRVGKAANEEPVVEAPQFGLKKSERMARRFNDWLKGVVERHEKESWGQDILDIMEEKGESPQDVADKFWSSTYAKLPTPVRQYFDRLLDRSTGLKPEVVRADPKNLDFGNEVQYLEGTDRGFVALMKDANDKFGGKAPRAKLQVIERRTPTEEEQAKLKADFEEGIRGKDLESRAGNTDHLVLPESVTRDLEAGTATVERALDAISKGSDSPLTRAIAHALRVALRGSDISIEYQKGMVSKKNGAPVAGKYVRSGDKIKILLDPELGAKTSTLLHEIVHAATAHVIEKPVNEVQRAAVADLQRMMDRAKTMTFADGEHYGFEDLREFVAEAMTNRGFQEALAKVPWEGFGPKQSLWQKFKDIIGRMISSLFPGRERTVLYNAILRSVDLFEAPRLERREELNQEAPKEHNAVIGVDKEGVRRSVSYKRDDGTYSHYYVTQEHKAGIPGGGTKGLTHEQLLAKLQEEGHKPLYVKNPNLAVEPRSTKKALGGYKDGQLVFAATPVKDAEGEPTGQWKITEGADLETKGSSRTTRVVEDYNDVIRARAERKLGPTRRTSEAMAQATEVGERPEVNLVLPSKFNLTLANREAPSIYAGTQVARAGLEQGRPVPESMRPDIANTLKISKTEHDIERLQHERIEPLQKAGREIAKKWKIKSEDQINRDITDLVYDHRADALLADDRYRDVPELETKVREQQAQAQQRLSQLPEGYKKELDAYLREWKKVSDELQDYKAKNELIPQDQADAVKSRYELYIPMRTDLKSTQGKRATGASAESTHPLLRIINDWNKAIRENYQNRELQATYRMAEAHNLPLPDGRQLFELEPITQYRYDDEGNIQLGVKNLTLDPDSVVVKFEGKPYRMKINDPDYRDALKFVPPNDKLQAINASMRAMAMVNAISGGLKTAASPLFALKNLRDIQTAFGQTDERVSRKEIAKALASRDTWEPAIRNAIEPWTGTRGSKYSEDTRNAYISRRGMAGLESQIERPSLTLVPTPLQRAGELRKNWLSFEHGKLTGFLTFFTKTGENLVRGAVFNAAMDSPKMWDSIGRANGTDGAAVKAAVDKYAAKQPLTPEEQTLVNHMHSEASSVAKNSTVNFEPKGRVSGPMNAMWLFANAKTQGARTYAERLGLTGIRGGENWRERLARGNPWTQGTTAVGTALGIASAMYLYKNDPDYPNMSDYQKDDYFTFGSGKLSIPLAPEMFWGYILGQSLVDAQMNPRWADPDMRKAKAATRFGTGLLQTFWPGGSSMSDPVGGAQGTTSQYWQRMVLPTLLQEMVVAPSANVNTFGSQIVPGLDEKGLPKSGVPLYAHNPEKVSPLAAKAASKLHQWGVVDAAPQMYQYYINQLVKSQVDFAHTVAPQWEFFNSIFGEPPKEPGGEERPNAFMRTFFQEASPLSTKNDLEELRQREAAKAYDRGEDPKKNPLVKMLQKGEDDSSKVFKGFGKMTPEQQKRATDRANEIRRNTLERYRQTQPQE